VEVDTVVGEGKTPLKGTPLDPLRAVRLRAEGGQCWYQHG